MIRHSILFILGVLVLAPSAHAQADPAAPPTDAKPVEGEAPVEARPRGEVDPIAERRAALDMLEAGWFGKAADAFAALARRADDAETRAWAEHLAALSRRWAARGLVLVPGPEAEASETAFGAARLRTTGEMAVLYVDGVFYGLGTGAWLAILSEPDSAAGAILPALAIAGSVAGGLALADRADAFGYAVPRSISAGLRLGLTQGALWTGWNEARSRRADEWSGKTSATVVWGVATIGAVAGGLLGDRLGATPGAASLVESAGLWGALVGGLVTYGATEGVSDLEVDDATLLGAALSLNLGAAAGVWLAGEVMPSPARVRYLDLGAISGGVLFGGLYLAFAGSNSEPSTMAITTALGVGGGIGTAWMLTRDMKTEPFPRATAESVSVGIVPTDGGAQIGIGGRW